MPARWQISFRIVAIIALILCAPAVAKEPPVKLDAAVGFNGVYRAGAWTPIYITLQSATPRAVLIELSMPHDASHTMRITSLASAGPEAVTLSLLAPLPSDLQLANVVIRDAGTGRTLADVSLDRANEPAGRVRFGSDADDLVIAYAGSASALPPRIELGQIGGATSLAIGVLPPNRLPAAAAGYESLDLLILGAPDLARLDAAAQQAIADWVYAGGSLLLWPGTAPLPAASPIVDLLPATVGENVLATIEPEALRSFGLPDRFAKLPLRQLSPQSGALPIALLGDAAKGFWIDRGLGRVMVLPFDPNGLLMQGQDAHQRLWRPIVGRLVGEVRIAEVVPDSGGTNMNAFSNMNAYMSGFSQNTAIDTAINMIGNIPGMGRFGFSYVLVILLGLMVVVGPVDWLVLKKLGRQPWTIYTTAGWIALVTLGAVYAGSLIRSGDLHLRTLELIEQAGDRVVARSHVAVVYSPRTQRYEIEPPRESWWRPASAQAYYVGGGLKTTMPFRQSAGANPPAAMSIPVWSMRFLRGEEFAPPDASPWIAADLTERSSGNQATLTGTIRNVGPEAIDGIELSSRGGSARLTGPIAPGATLRVETPLARSGGAVPPPPEPARGFGEWAPSDAARAFGIDTARQQRLTDRIFRENDAPPRVTILATTPPGPTSPISLAGQSPLVQHRRIIRATLPLRSEVTP